VTPSISAAEKLRACTEHIYECDGGTEGPVEDSDQERATGNSVSVTIFLPKGKTSTVTDTDAQSFWVDKEWFIKQGGKVQHDDNLAEGADGGRLLVAGKGFLRNLTLWSQICRTSYVRDGESSV
jgi:hypothetical protein